MIQKLILALLLISFNSFAQSHPEQIKEFKINFTITHPVKTVRGNCKNPIISDLNLIRKNETYSIEKPFSVHCNFLDMKTGNGNRDSHLLETLRYPEEKNIGIRVNSLIQNGNGYELKTTIILNQISVERIIKVENTKIEKGISEFAGNFLISLKEHRIEPPSLLFVSIRDDIYVDFSMKLKID